MLSGLCHGALVTPWEVIEGALARKKPKRDQAWLAKKLDISEQAISNWKERGVPRSRYEDLADALGLTLEQIAGRAAAPWEVGESEWPFASIDAARWSALTERQRGEIEGKVRELIEKFEAQRSTGSGKSSPSQSSAPQRKHGT